MVIFVWNGDCKKVNLLRKMDSVPTYDLWLREMANTLHLEKLRFYNDDRGGVFDTIWHPVRVRTSVLSPM